MVMSIGMEFYNTNLKGCNRNCIPLYTLMSLALFSICGVM